MASLSTHVLDTARGKPAAGVVVTLEREGRRLAVASTDAEGRVPRDRLSPEPLPPGAYELRFKVADYFRGANIALPDPPFLDEIFIRFGIADEAAHYHVPLLVSPYGYSTYRGS